MDCVKLVAMQDNAKRRNNKIISQQKLQHLNVYKSEKMYFIMLGAE